MAWYATKTWAAGDPLTGVELTEYLREDFLLHRGDPQWLYPLLLNGWKNYGGGLAQISYRMAAGSFIQIRGMVMSTFSGQVIAFQNPPTTNRIVHIQYSPKYVSSQAVISNLNYGRIDIWTNGDIGAVIGSYQYIDLSGCSFRANWTG
jgi:hypothetical protein